MTTASLHWSTRRRQFLTIVGLELRKSLRGLRALWVYLLALAPVLIVGLHTAHALVTGHPHPLETDTEILAGIFQFYYLRLGLFFGCLGIFTRLFRGDMMERSLHYYLLAPVRREVLACGKFAAGVLAILLVFGTAVILLFASMYLHFGRAAVDFIAAEGLAHLGAYLLVTALAGIGYGATFLLLGQLFKNPVIPALVVLLWESVNKVLPVPLKLVSVVFYLEPLLPVEVQAEGLSALFAIPAEPIRAALAIPGLMLVSGLVLLLACLRTRSMEINYSGE
jgi:ABC-type transport system involved in multi-copper enzyme maturation permease subunit